MITYEYDLDVTPGGAPVCVNLSQYDEDFELKFRLYSREGYLEVKSGTTADIRGTKKDGKGYSATAVIDGNIVMVSGNVQMTAVSGKQIFELKLRAGGKVLNTANFLLYVERAALDQNTIVSDSVIKELEGVSEMADRIIEDLRKTENNVRGLAENVSDDADNAATSAAAAARSASAAATSTTAAAKSASNAAASAAAADKSASAAGGYAEEAESYAHGNTGTRQNEDVDNARYYYEQAKRISQGMEGTLLPMGTVTFGSLEQQDKIPGYMYNIVDAFTTTETFKEGAGYRYPSGTNVYRTADGYWDCLAGTSVVSVNGQIGAVTITPENIGAANKESYDEDKKEIQTALQLVENPVFEEASTLSNIESGEDVSTIFGKIKKVMGSLLIGAGSTLLGQNLTAARALVSDVNGKVGVSTITAAELGNIAGLTKNAQEQFNELNENLGTKTAAPVNGLSSNPNRNIISKSGNVCYLEYRNNDGSFSGTDVICTLPEGYRPSMTRFVTGNVVYDSVWHTIIFQITPDGKVIQSWGSKQFSAPIIFTAFML